VRGERAERQLIIRMQRWRRRSIFSARVVVAPSKHDGDETLSVAAGERWFASEPHLDSETGAGVHAMQARWQCCRVVGDYQIARA
jgi:hypothetical protein